MKIRTGQVVKYVLLPQIWPRINGLLSGAFAQVAYLMAIVMQSARLLPSGHPYTYSNNAGRFGLYNVVGEAYKNLKWDRAHLDQWFIFSAIVLGVFLIGLQLLAVVIVILVPSAFAFGVLNLQPPVVPDDDLALIFLDRVFGIPDLFGSRVSNGSDGPFPNPMHQGLEALFYIYNIAIMVVGVAILLYFMTTVAAETAKDGTPFGKRFNRIWAPLRLVFAIGLLIPVGSGYNTAQYIVLYAAKWGSNFATNGWVEFNDSLNETYLGIPQNLIAKPNVPEVGTLLQFMHVAKLCKIATEYYGYERNGDTKYRTVNAYLINNEPVDINRYNLDVAGIPGIDELYQFFNNGNITIRFGTHDPDEYKQLKGQVAPFCGEIVIPVTAPEEPGVRDMTYGYFQGVVQLWLDTQIEDTAILMARARLAPNDASSSLPPMNNATTTPADASFKSELYNNYRSYIEAIIDNGVEEQKNNGVFVDGTLIRYGWGGAAIWYNKIAQMNGPITESVFNIPRPSIWPSVMVSVAEFHLSKGRIPAGAERFNPELPNEEPFTGMYPGDYDTARALYDLYSFWLNNGLTYALPVGTTGTVVVSERPKNSTAIDIANILFGTSGLFNMRDNEDIHPLAQLTSVGKGLMETSIRNLGIATGISIFGDLAKLLDGHNISVKMASKLMITFASISMSIGFILFYVLPLLPFVYYLFAVATWIKTIFEALVGAPLWALAHIRIDGDGLPGSAAFNGYLLIFEIFLRPILILFGLLGSILIFGAMIKVLNDLWDMVVTNLTGFDVYDAAEVDFDPLVVDTWRGPVDEFFYTVIYAIIVYMMAMSSFKLIDLVPNNILRWAGQSVSSFGDTAGDPAGELMSTSSQAFTMTSQKFGQAVEHGQAAGGQGLELIGKLSKRR